MAHSSDNQAAQDLGRREEASDEARRNEDLLRDFQEKESLDARERNENMRVAMETPVTYDPSHSEQVAMLSFRDIKSSCMPILRSSSTDVPRFSVSCSGPPVLSLSSQTYVLSAQLRYLSGKDNQPITILNGRITGTAWGGGEAYLFYAADGRSVDTGEAIEHEFLEKNYEDEPRPVSAENGFTTLKVGESVDRRVEIILSWWLGLEVGKEYELLMPRAHIGWWEYGTMDVSMQSAAISLHSPLLILRLQTHEGTEVAPSDTRDDGGLTIPRSNALRLQVVA